MTSNIILFICAISIKIGVSIESNNDWNLNIIHTNDMHSRFDEFKTPMSECLPAHKESNQCYGGFARVATLVREARNASNSMLYLDAGDVFAGTPWFTEYKWKIASQFMNILKPDVATLGNHEFDNGPGGLAPYLKKSNFPIVVCNVDFSMEPELKDINISKSIIFNINGHKVGVIGYLTPDTKYTTSTGKVTFSSEIECIQNEIKKLQNQNVNIIIGLGHSGYDFDKKLAQEVEGLDLIIGGHSHSFLYTGDVPDTDVPLGLYPTVIEQKISKRKVYIVQAYAFTKYLGNLSITFDADGEIKAIRGSPVLLDHKIPQAVDVVQALNELKSRIEAYSHKSVGYTRVLLDHSLQCRTKECNLGNLVTDAMIEDNLNNIQDNDNGWTDAAVAVVGSGTIKSCIHKLLNETITMADIKHVLPHANKIYKYRISGKKLLEVLENSVALLQHGIENDDPSGRFLHVSGIQVHYDLSKPIGSKVITDLLLIRCAECLVPKFEQWNIDKNYTILINEFIATGGDGFTMLIDEKPLSIGITLEECVANYIQQKKVVFPSVEGRIKFINPDELQFIDLDIETVIQVIDDDQ
ncbi:protein 5NUC-like [Chelonus insularis]|uniref:protein 5NUC-like n=1 Tax=Chelonus insularis TaxID=460826 RepID=UPI00158B8936|nr:protein 5NUC-like [Chelonus insularis]